jgi:molybdate transport system substrate-binding protein
VLRKLAVFGSLLIGQIALAQGTLQIAAAADLQPVLPPILAKFQAMHGIEVKASYASSATLATQIVNGGPFDLFLSADVGFAQRVIDAGLASETKPVPYAKGTLVLWERSDGPVHPLTIDALKSSAVQSVAIANAEHAPYGRAAMASLTSLHLVEAVQPKLRVAENIAQAAQFAESGNAQLGLISLTSASTPKLQSEGSYVEMPTSSYPAILQGAVVVRRAGGDAKDAQMLLDFLLSAPVQAELAEHGLKPPPA